MNHRTTRASTFRPVRYEPDLRHEPSVWIVARAQTGWPLPVSTLPGPSQMTPAHSFEPTKLSATASVPKQMLISSLSTLCKNARFRVNLGRTRRIDATKIQCFLKQTETASKIRHGLHPA